MGHPASINTSIFTELGGSVWRWTEWLCVSSDDSEWWSYYKWSSHKRIINSFETRDCWWQSWLARKGLRDWERSLRWEAGGNSMARCWFSQLNHSVLSADLSLSVEVFLTVAVGCHVSAVCVMLGCDALIIACHFSFPSHSFTSGIFSFYLLFFLHSRWPEWCSFFSSFWRLSQASHVLKLLNFSKGNNSHF